jgi:hypothetical protein
MSGSQFHFPRKGFVRQTFTTPGTHSFVIPPGVNNIIALVVGAGGGGGGSNGIFGGSGGGGAAVLSSLLSVNPGETLTIFIGQGGTGGTTSSGATNGQDSYIQSSINRFIAAGGDAGGNGGANAGVLGVGYWNGGNGGQGSRSGFGSGDYTAENGENSQYNTGGLAALGAGINLEQGGGGGASYGVGGNGGGTNPTLKATNGGYGAGGGGGTGVAGTNGLGGNGGDGLVYIAYKADF